MRLTEEEAKTYRKMILQALESFEQPGPLSVSAVAYGPRHHELSFAVSNGKRILVTLSEESWRS